MNRTSRRTFLLGAASATVAMYSFSHGEKPAPSERLRVGAVGIAGQGFGDLRAIAAGGAEIVALCDVHESRKEVGQQREHFSKAKFYTDFRKMIATGGLDAVMVATPDHSHFTATRAALDADLHVFCEKPLTHTVQEARIVAELAKKKKRVTQMGTQIHAGGNYRRVVEIIQSGAIGEVKEAHTWCDKSWGGGGRLKEQPVPRGLDWDLWVGPAPMRPYNSGYVPFNWRHWWDFGGGTLNDMACHHMDLPFWALGLRHPTSVKAEGTPVSPETAAVKLQVTYTFAIPGKAAPITLTWYDGGLRPKHFKDKGFPKWGDGNLFVGTKGMMLADYGRYKLLPEKDFAGFKPPKETIPNSIGHYKEWVQACKTGGKTTCNFDYSGALTECVLLGNVAYRLGKPFTWNAKELKASEAGAEKYIKKTYRKGWGI
jgi:predicted dehydrogenase